MHRHICSRPLEVDLRSEKKMIGQRGMVDLKLLRGRGENGLIFLVWMQGSLALMDLLD